MPLTSTTTTTTHNNNIIISFFNIILINMEDYIVNPEVMVNMALAEKDKTNEKIGQLQTFAIERLRHTRPRRIR